jgi:phosphate transport system ATP-binding protein
VDPVTEVGTTKAATTVGIDPSIVSMVDDIPSKDPVVAIMSLRDVAVSFNGKTAVRDVSFDVGKNRVTSMIGPSGSGKTTLLRSLNRLHDLTRTARVTGEIRLDGVDIYRGGIPTTLLRTRIGMVFQRPNPFPTMSIYDNVASGLRFNGIKRRSVLDDAVEHSLRAAALWDSVEKRLKVAAATLSGGEQQRLCIARALAVEPEILLMDEPTSSLDPVSTQRIEDLMTSLKEIVTIIIVTHNMQQAARVSDDCAFLLMGDDRAGELIEFATTEKIFTEPSDKRTLDYIQGRFG